jgi:hypothetical protein
MPAVSPRAKLRRRKRLMDLEQPDRRFGASLIDRER